MTLDLNAKVTVDSGQAVQALDQTKRAADATTRAVGEGSRSATSAAQETVAALQRQGQAAAAAAAQVSAAANRQRASYQQLGFQISDVAAQAAVGTNPMIIFAQQGGQVAQALAGMGGVVGRVAAFLAGPWGAAVLGAGAVLGVLISKQREAASASDGVGAAAERQKQALEELDRLARQQSENEEARIQRLGREAAARLTTAAAVRREIDAKIALAIAEERAALRRSEDPTLAGEGGFNPGIAAAASARGRIEALQAQRAANLNESSVDQIRVRAAQFASAQQAAKAATDGVAAATQRYNAEVARLGAAVKAGRITQQEATKGLIAAELALAKAREDARRSSPASSANRRAESAAARAAERELERQIKLTEALRIARDNLDLAGGRSAAELVASIRTVNPRDDELAGLARDADKRREEAKELGRRQAEAASAEMLQRAAITGRAIGGAVGNTIAGLAEGLRVGDFRGVPGRAGGAIQLAQDSGLLKKITDKLDSIFGKEGDGSFVKGLNKALETAGFGAEFARTFGKGTKEEQIGGAVGANVGQAIGAAIPIPGASEIGKIIGAAIGTAVGGLFVRPRFGSVTLGASNGEVTVGAATGTGGAQRKAAETLGDSISGTLSQIVDSLGASIGDFAVSIGQNGKFFRVDPTGQGRTSKRDPGVLRFGEDANAAVQAAIADAIRDGAIAGVSPRVQGVLRQYANDVNKAVAEALKVQDLESQLADRLNPFATVFRDFERQAAERLRVARQYGFDLVEIERLNAEQRNKLVTDSIANVATSARTLLDELRFGSRSEGSITERLDRLGAERARLQGLVDGGDLGQIDKLASVVQQQIDLSREAFGSTGRFAADRNASIATLEAVIRQAEARAEDAQLAAQRQTVDKLSEANSTLDEQTRIQQEMLAAIRALAGAGSVPGFDPAQFQRAFV